MSGDSKNDTAGERRGSNRVTTIYRPALIETEEFAGFCLIRNLSPDGMMGEIYTSLANGTAIQIEFGEALATSGQVVWCKDRKIGIKFDNPIDVTDVLANLSHRTYRGKTNRAPRLSIQVSGYVIVDDRQAPVEVQDISQKGIKLRSNALQVDDEVVVVLPDFDTRKAVVRWTTADLAGLNFFQPIPYELLGEWVIRQQLGELDFSEPVVVDQGASKYRSTGSANGGDINE